MGVWREYCLQLRRLNRAFLYLVNLTSLTPSPVFFPVLSVLSGSILPIYHVHAIAAAETTRWLE